MKNSSRILIATAAGVAIGGTLGVLLAPGKGSESRKMINKKFARFSGLLNGECSKEKLEMVKQKMEKHRERLDKHLQRINARIQKAEAVVAGSNGNAS